LVRKSDIRQTVRIVAVLETDPTRVVEGSALNA
jgi:hypothetical protein